MNKWQKLGFIAGVSGITLTTIHILNKFIFSHSIRKEITFCSHSLIYKWKFGEISYTKKGTGSPLLLIHDLQNTSSSYEWNSVINELSQNHTVFALDLLGCGHSGKPNITYTIYLYVQLMNDFITNVIGKKTSVIVTGKSSSIILMSCYNNPNLYTNIILINPESVNKATLIPNKNSAIFRRFLNSPIIGTLIYNITMSKYNTKKYFKKYLFYNSSSISNQILDAYIENSHLSGSSAKYLYTSTRCRYTTASIGRAISEINNSIYIIYGSHEIGITETLKEYISINPAIESAKISNCRHLPQLECPADFLKMIHIFL